MPGLVLKLAPNERIYINGALIENGARRATLCLRCPETEILRERDLIAPRPGQDALEAACLLAQQALMQRDGRAALLARLHAQFGALLRDPAYRGNARIVTAAARLAAGSLSGAHWHLLGACRAPEAHPGPVAEDGGSLRVAQR